MARTRGCSNPARTIGCTNAASIDDGTSNVRRYGYVYNRRRPLNHAFPGGPYDLSVIRSFKDHVALRLWNGEDRGPLKVAAHGLKLRKFVKGELPQEVQHFVDASKLTSLVKCSFSTVDNALISAFAERWYRDTSSFHLPVGEMTITLDDVTCLLHIPMRGEFFTFPVLNSEKAIAIVMQLLDVPYQIASKECSQNRGPHLRLGWLRKLYKEKCANQEWEPAARAFLLHLVGCTIFTNKSQSLIDIKYLEMFRDLKHCGNWAWGAAALAVLYEHLGDASMHHTKQIGGYMTLIQAWIYEHFPYICERTCVEGYSEQFCRALRWRSVKGDGKMEPIRRRLDGLSGDDVIWNPYKSQRYNSGFDPTSLFSGYIRFGTIMVPHLPERVVRQFGHVQFIPPRPPQQVTGAVSTPTEVDHKWLHRFDFEYLINIPTSGPVESDETVCSEGYMEWYKRISHPFIIRPSDVVQPPATVASDVVEPPPPTDVERQPTTDESVWQERCHRAAELLQTISNRQPFPKGSDLLDRLLRIVQGDKDGNDYEDPHHKRKKKKTTRSTQ